MCVVRGEIGYEQRQLWDGELRDMRYENWMSATSFIANPITHIAHHLSTPGYP